MEIKQKYAEIEDKIQELENIVDKYKIDGIECYYSNYSNAETSELLKFVKKYNLLMSGGSDYHGGRKSFIELGIGKGNLEVPDDILKSWNFILKQ